MGKQEYPDSQEKELAEKEYQQSINAKKEIEKQQNIAFQKKENDKSEDELQKKKKKQADIER